MARGRLMSPQFAEGKLVALQRCAEEGAARGWDTVPALVDLLLAITRSDRMAQPDPERAVFHSGWGAGVLTAAGHLMAPLEQLADRIRASVIEAELAVLQP